MITKRSIDTVVKRLVKAYDPLEIYLFGSYAWENPEESDLDLSVLKTELLFLIKSSMKEKPFTPNHNTTYGCLRLNMISM